MSDENNNQEPLSFTMQLENGKVHASTYGKEAYEQCLKNAVRPFTEVVTEKGNTIIHQLNYQYGVAFLNCPEFVHTYYEAGTTCPKGFAVMNSFTPEDGKPFVQCGGVIENAVIHVDDHFHGAIKA